MVKDKYVNGVKNKQCQQKEYVEIIMKIKIKLKGK